MGKTISNDIQACRVYVSKLNLLGKDASGLFNVETDGIAIDLLKLAELQDYPETLRIPSFVTYIGFLTHRGMDNVFRLITEEMPEDNVHKIILPDKLKLNNAAYSILRDFKHLQSISITNKQYDRGIETPYKREIRQ